MRCHYPCGCFAEKTAHSPGWEEGLFCSFQKCIIVHFIKAKVKEFSLSQQSDGGIYLAVSLLLQVSCWKLGAVAVPMASICFWESRHVSNITRSSHLGQGQGNASIPVTVTTDFPFSMALTFHFWYIRTVCSLLELKWARASSDRCVPQACLKKVFPTWRSCVSDWVTVFNVCKMSLDISASCPEIAWNPGVYISAFLLIHSGIIKQLLNLLELWFLIWRVR